MTARRQRLELGAPAGNRGAPSPRIERRRRTREERLLTIAARRFAEHGLDGVRLDEIADEADVARGTLYSHFPTKEALVEAIVRPALERVIAHVAPLAESPPEEAVVELLRVYVDLWRTSRDPLRVAHRVRSMPLGELAPLHGALMVALTDIARRAAARGLLRAKSPELGVRMLGTLAVPMLELCETESPDGELFVESMAALVLRL